MGGEGSGRPSAEPPEAHPVDDERLQRLFTGAALVLARRDRHTPLERTWAQQVLDLASALAEARRS